MLSISNFKIVFKISLIIAMLTLVTVGTIGYAAMRMQKIDEVYTDLVDRVSNATISAARASRFAEGYVSTAYQLLTELTEEGNANLLGENVEYRTEYEVRMADVLKGVPEKAALIKPVLAQFKSAFSSCEPVIQEAAESTTAEGNAKAALRLKGECKPQIFAAIAAHSKMVDELSASTLRSSSGLTDQTWSTIWTAFFVTGIGSLVGLVMALFIGIKGLSQPIARLKAVMEAFANNDLKHEVPGVARRDELGEMARTVEVFKTNAIEVARMRESQAASDAQRAARRKADMMKLASDFEGAVGEIIQAVASAATELEASANSLTSTAERTEKLSTVVASAAEEASSNVQSVASASEEMSSSVNEISRQVQESARIAGEAVVQARDTNDRVNELSVSANKIGDVVKLISTIAEQTNLLALNATIESARAGDAGRGFAVVASEVKALAEQTSKATGEIGQQIAAIQLATEGSVDAIKEIGQTIGRISEISSLIAAAVEEQGAATQEIARNVQQASQGTSEVASNISDVQRGSSETGSASTQVLSSAQSLSVESNRLKAEVQNFLATVRAA